MFQTNVHCIIYIIFDSQGLRLPSPPHPHTHTLEEGKVDRNPWLARYTCFQNLILKFIGTWCFMYLPITNGPIKLHRFLIDSSLNCH